MTYRSHRGWDEADSLDEVATILARGVLRYQQARQSCSAPRTRLVKPPEKVSDDRLSSTTEPCSLDTRVKSTTLKSGENECR